MRFPVQLVANVRTFDGAPRISDFVIEEKMFAGKRNYPRIKGELRQLKLSHDHSLISCPPCVTDSFHFRFLEQSLTTPLSPNISASSSMEPKVRFYDPRSQLLSRPSSSKFSSSRANVHWDRLHHEKIWDWINGTRFALDFSCTDINNEDTQKCRSDGNNSFFGKLVVSGYINSIWSRIEYAFKLMYLKGILLYRVSQI